MSANNIISPNSIFHVTGEAQAFIPAPGNNGKPITVIGTEAIRNGFDATCLQQALNSRGAPGVTDLVLNPDAHAGYGAPVGCVMVSPTHIYPGPVGVDIKCSMSLLQMNIPDEVIADKRVRRELINAIEKRTPTGAGRGQGNAKLARKVSVELGEQAVTQGASREVCEALGIPPEWASRCEDSYHVGHDGNVSTLVERLEKMRAFNAYPVFAKKIEQFGSYGGGNHFGECERVELSHTNSLVSKAAEAFGLKDQHVAFLSHCGSRGFGHDLASRQFKSLESFFHRWGLPMPAIVS
jgi:tRNA-splicing ligase RtcB